MDGQATKTLAVNTREEGLYGTVQQEVELGVRALSGRDPKMAIMLFQSALQKLTIGQSFHDHLVHNLLLSYKLLIEQNLDRGELDAGASILERALELEILGAMALDIEFRKSFALVFDSLGLVFFRHGQFDESVGCCRKALSIHPSPGFRINLENALRASGQQALLSDFTADHANEQLGRHIFIACVPKSGSTFL
jgi:tetratricopeptide (TPR) repeat protein